MTTTQSMSIFIPRVFIQVTEQQLKELFNTFGLVSHVDFVSISKNGQCYNAAYVHFKWWIDAPFVGNFRSRLQEKNGVRLYYNDARFYLVCRENTGEKHERIIYDVSHARAVAKPKTEAQPDFESIPTQHKRKCTAPDDRAELARIDFLEIYTNAIEKELKACREALLMDHAYLAEMEHKNTLFMDEISCLSLENSLLKEKIECYLY